MLSSVTVTRRLRIQKKALQQFWNVYKTKRAGLIGLAILVVLCILAAFPSVFSPYNPQATGGVISFMSPPSWAHPFGTDDAGQDVLSEAIWGARGSLLIGFFATGIAILIGSAVGLLSGFYGGVKGEFLMRVTDIFLVLPALPLMIVLAAVLSPSLWNVALVIGITGWTGTARIVRSSVISLRERTYVYRARAVGCSDRRIVLQHILPDVVPLIFANAVIVAAFAVASEAFLSFLGLGDLSTISWGSMLYFAFNMGAFTVGAYWYFLPPGLLIVITILAFTGVGYGLDEVLNPRLRKT
ncbi:MAG TPA: ABC transporter permease [archaeon]|nr:ABC transporter permease [archaeon]